MAISNDSASRVFLNEYRYDLSVFMIISVFDEMEDRLVKETFIQACQCSEKAFYKKLGRVLESRHMEPPEQLPDDKFLYADVVNMGECQLREWVKNAKFFIALKYNTRVKLGRNDQVRLAGMLGQLTTTDMLSGSQLTSTDETPLP